MRACPSSDEIPAHVVPIAFGRIDFRGVCRFLLERYVDRLVPSTPTVKQAIGEWRTYPQEDVTFGKNP